MGPVLVVCNCSIALLIPARPAGPPCRRAPASGRAGGWLRGWRRRRGARSGGWPLDRLRSPRGCDRPSTPSAPLNRDPPPSPGLSAWLLLGLKLHHVALPARHLYVEAAREEDEDQSGQDDGDDGGGDIDPGHVGRMAGQSVVG